ncbi:excitatory amino acid transporter 3 isoform X2 [Folsomia candida]|nr:excitatory amino acid transporter 3 isoform X2 [Folsomia candida]XP_035713164.1 excitatory amino acid transporter 3 isoform X2 [Folsomia candida]XP_035713165.1 excitatory amino acid transporter 3 isoform X2 [Folsomia candida]
MGKKFKAPTAEGCAKCLRTNLLTLLTVAGVLSGVALGFILRGSRDEKWSQREQVYVKFAGDIFLRMLKALILPLIVSSLISAIGSLDLTLSGKIGVRALAYYMFTTLCAVVLGIILVVAIHPGKVSADPLASESKAREVTTADTLMDLIRNMFPPNLVQAASYQYQTVLEPPTPAQLAAAEAIGKNITVTDYLMKSKYTEGTNIMGLVVFSTVLGITLGKMGAAGKPLLDFFTSLSGAMMIITNWVVWLSPVGVCFLIAAQLLEADDIGHILEKLGMYFMTVLLGLFIHGFVVLPFLYGLVTRKMPFQFIMNMTQALATAFGTASSSATLPITIGCLEDKNGVDPRVSRFVLPIGATINMDGTALYEAVAAIFISQMANVPLSLGNIIAISITATAASIGAAGIPQAGLVTMVMVLNTVGLNADYVAYIIPVDWLLDRFRTTINVLGDSLGAGLVDVLSKAELDSMPATNELGLGAGKRKNTATSEDVECHTTPI